MDDGAIKAIIEAAHADIMRRVHAVEPKAGIIITVVSGTDHVVAHNYATQAGLKHAIALALSGLEEH
jgi:pyrimidine deaminase RibD-like protein